MAKKGSEQEIESTKGRSKALDDYVARVGAEELNFRKFMVKHYKGGNNYYVEKTIIRINNDGTIFCSRKEHSPTETEAKAIAQEFIKLEIPRSVRATQAAADKHMRALQGESYKFVDRHTGLVSMIQEKWNKPDGGKVYIPWTYWSDGQWRKMEPDGDLPFWKPHKKRKPGRVMVHEGAKAGAYCDALVNDPEKKKELASHPWGAELSQYEHWGMIGGALAPHRSDYAELVREQPSEVVYVCDNDYSGESALQIVSKFYGESLVGIKFGRKFPESWDMADPIPDTLYAGRGEERRYVGPSMRALMHPATRATELVPNGSGKGRPTAVIRRPFLEEWVHAIRPEVFIHKNWPWEIWIREEFNNKVRPFSDVDDTARLVKGDDASKSAVLKYNPGLPPGIYSDQERYINTYMPPDIKEEDGDTAPLADFLRHLIPGEKDRLEVSRWCATLIARPDIKMNYGLLLISEVQGVGKGTLGEKILTPLVGTYNVSFPSENDIVDSNYNYWLAHKRLAVVHEIYAGHSSKAYNRMKSIITDKYITVSKKFQANYEIENYVHVYANSNSPRAIQMTMDDRRWYVPKVTDQKKPTTYWVEFNRWLSDEGGLGIVKHWARLFIEENGPVVGGADAPWSEMKTQIVEEGYSPGQELVAKTLKRLEAILEGDSESDKETRAKWKTEGMLVNSGSVAVLDVDLVRLITDVIHQGRPSDRLEKPMTVRKLAKSLGWHVGEERVNPKMNEWGSGAHLGRVLSNDRELAATSPTMLGGKSGEGSKLRVMPLNLEWARVI